VQVQRSQDPAIHNYLLSLFVQEATDEHLLRYLQNYSDYYDHKYALRVCLKAEKNQASVIIYRAMHLYEEAIDLALKV
jgi:vacuolar protein sorting-associated protein 18